MCMGLLYLYKGGLNLDNSSLRNAVTASVHLYQFIVSSSEWGQRHCEETMILSDLTPGSFTLIFFTVRLTSATR